MRLLCPHCRKELEVADHLAGQVQNCPQCQKPFRVPIPPTSSPGPSATVATPITSPASPAPSATPGIADSALKSVTPPSAAVGWSSTTPVYTPSAASGAAAPVPPSSAPGVSPAVPAWTAPAGTGSVSPPFPAAPAAQTPVPPTIAVTPSLTLPAPVPSPGYSASIVLLTFSSFRLHIVEVIGIWLLVLLLFCPWLRVPPGTGIFAQQSGLQVAFGRVSSPLQSLQPRASALGVVYFILTWISAIASLLLLVAMKLDWPELRPYLRFRALAMGGLILLLVAILFLQMLVGFPLQNAWTEHARLKEDEAKALYAILELVKVQWLATLARAMTENPADSVAVAWGLYGSWLITTMLVLVVLLDFWLERRLANYPPRLLLEK